MDNQKQFEHDCPSCKYLGHYHWIHDPNGRHEYDLYVCAQGGNVPTVIARYGNAGPDYMSGIHHGLINLEKKEENISYPLTVALYLALVEGYLTIKASSLLKKKE